MGGYKHAGWTLEEWTARLRDVTSETGVFTTTELNGLDQPVRRHLSQAIAPGTQLAQCAQISMRGRIKLGRWLPFRARQVLRPDTGFIWAARVAGVVVGSDRYLNGVGGMDWKLGGVLKLVHAEGPDVSMSTAGRCGAEAAWLPTTLLPRFGVRWSAQSQDDIRARYLLDDVPIDARYRLGPRGELQSTVFDRWGDPDETGEWGWHRFGGIFTEQRTFGGLTIPSAGRLGWHFGTDRWDAGELFRFQITDVKALHPGG